MRFGIKNFRAPPLEESEKHLVEKNGAMASHRVSFRRLNGESILFDIMPEITGRELKERIKECLPWDVWEPVELLQLTTSRPIPFLAPSI